MFENVSTNNGEEAKKANAPLTCMGHQKSCPNKYGTKRKAMAAIITLETKKARSRTEESDDEDCKLPTAVEGKNETNNMESQDPRTESEHVRDVASKDGSKDAKENKIKLDEGETLMGFGKYCDLTFRQAYSTDPGYYKWAKKLKDPSEHMKRFLDWVDKSTEDENRSKQTESAKSRSVSETTKFSFGKHAGETFSHVAMHDPSYVAWARSLETPNKQLREFVLWVGRSTLL